MYVSKERMNECETIYAEGGIAVYVPNCYGHSIVDLFHGVYLSGLSNFEWIHGNIGTYHSQLDRDCRAGSGTNFGKKIFHKVFNCYWDDDVYDGECSVCLDW